MPSHRGGMLCSENALSSGFSPCHHAGLSTRPIYLGHEIDDICDVDRELAQKPASIASVNTRNVFDDGSSGSSPSIRASKQ